MSNDDPGEPTTPLPPQQGQWSGQPTGQSYNPYPPPYQTQGGYYGQQPQSPYPPPTQPYPVRNEGSRARVPGWMWPVVAAMALVLGVAGGAIAGALVVSNQDSGTGGVLTVQRRTAPPLPADNGSIAAVAAKVLPSTVQIVAEYDGKDQGATGSGFVLDDQGHIITNSHVVAQADEDDGPIDIIDQNGNHSKATVVGRSTVYDIAVLKSEGAKKLTPAAIGSADQMRVGETVVAIGSPLGLSATVTSGIVSAIDRPVTTGDGANDNSYINAVQTDAAINPGNSGGPLVNLQGEVVGVNSAIASLGSQVASDQGGNIGVGFAIPIEQVQVTTAQILRTGKAQYPLIGANVRGTPKLDGATVESITPGMPAADTDLKVGDVIRKVDGKPVTGSIDLVVAVRSHVPGEKVTLTVERGKKTFTVEVGLVSKTG
ncbi:MAG: peptidase and chymotrypsin/Hap [Marmoricola sp.]|nr:peptidase and chymotrypsin/Hap [Marmoricola sp.]